MPNRRSSRLPPGGKKLPKQPRNVKGASESKKTKPSNDKKETQEVNDPERKKMTLSTLPSVSTPRPQQRERRPGRPPSSGKRMNGSRDVSGKVRSAYRRSLDPCDNSNDSGLGFDHHMDPHHLLSVSERLTWSGERAEAKRPRLDIKLEHDEVNDGYGFPDGVYTCKESQALIRTAPASSVPSLSINSNSNSQSGRAVPRCIPLSSRQSPSSPVPLTMQLSSSSHYGDVILKIIKQPEQQHRARYQTEGSRGAVKDREGNGFPVVQLLGYCKPTTLQVFIGTDVGKVSPHMFYQACKVSGKNSTPCMEKKIDGTCVIELQLDPSKDMSATCDCVGILKERNVDVEHRFPDQLGNRSKKKSTRCRMIFRTTITLDDGTQETLQVCSQPIVCTQPPGIPEICKKSLTSCPASGGLELFIFGKNFLKDTRVLFQLCDDDRRIRWEQYVNPDKEFLQQTHLVCVVPPFHRPDITEPVSVRLCVVSSGKTSEPHHFVYTPVNGGVMPSVRMDSHQPQSQFFNKMLWPSSISKREQDLGMMPPPESSMVPLSTRRSSISVPSTSDIIHSPPLHAMKQEYIDENSESSIIDPVEMSQGRFRHISESSLDVHHGDSNMSMINDNSIDMLRRNSLGAEPMNPNLMNENSNLSIVNENSMDMLVRRRNSMSRPGPGPVPVPVSSICENSNISVVNEDSSCSTGAGTGGTGALLAQPILQQKILSVQGDLSNASVEDLKVMDLTMKMPMATVADLANTSAPSMATLQKFCMTETSCDPLPAQSAQSVENYLTNIEGKALLAQTVVSNSEMAMKANVSAKLSEIVTTGDAGFVSQKILNRQLMQQTCSGLLAVANPSLPTSTNTSALLNEQEPVPVFLTSQRSFLSGASENDVLNIVAKSEAAGIAEKILPEQTVAPSNIDTLCTTIESKINTIINTEKLDALVNSTVESHMGSPKRSEAKDLLNNKLSLVTTNASSQEMRLLSNQSALMVSVSVPVPVSVSVPPLVNTTLASPTREIVQPQVSPNISTEVILNSQLSPTLMCRNSAALPQDGLLPSASLNSLVQTSNAIEPGLLDPAMARSRRSPAVTLSSLHSPIISATLQQMSEPEKAVIRDAAQDLLEAQKQLNRLEKMGGEVLPGGPISIVTTVENFVAPPSQAIGPETTKADFVIPVPVKEMAQNDKKNEDRMIPQSFTSLTENELINFINPSCFDQV